MNTLDYLLKEVDKIEAELKLARKDYWNYGGLGYPTEERQSTLLATVTALRAERAAVQAEHVAGTGIVISPDMGVVLEYAANNIDFTFAECPGKYIETKERLLSSGCIEPTGAIRHVYTVYRITAAGRAALAAASDDAPGVTP